MAVGALLEQCQEIFCQLADLKFVQPAIDGRIATSLGVQGRKAQKIILRQVWFEAN
jgi:hypothetical protein